MKHMLSLLQFCEQWRKTSCPVCFRFLCVVQVFVASHREKWPRKASKKSLGLNWKCCWFTHYEHTQLAHNTLTHNTLTHDTLTYDTDHVTNHVMWSHHLFWSKKLWKWDVKSVSPEQGFQNNVKMRCAVCFSRARLPEQVRSSSFCKKIPGQGNVEMRRSLFLSRLLEQLWSCASDEVRIRTAQFLWQPELILASPRHDVGFSNSSHTIDLSFKCQGGDCQFKLSTRGVLSAMTRPSVLGSFIFWKPSGSSIQSYGSSLVSTVRAHSFSVGVMTQGLLSLWGVY